MMSGDVRLTADDGGELYVSINTVNTHIRNIYSKLGPIALRPCEVWS